MRLFLLIFLMLVTVSAAEDRLILSAAPPEKLDKPKPSCSVYDLYVMAWTIHDPMERRIAMLEWLDKNVCSTQNYTDIWNSLSEWAGASDNALLRAKVIQGYEKAFRRESK